MSAAATQVQSKAQPISGGAKGTAAGDTALFIGIAAAVLLMPFWLVPFGAAYPDLMQKFVIFGTFAVGFNLLFGLTGYLSFGHAAFLGVGSYTAVWTFKLLGMGAVPAVITSVLVAGLFALAIGFVSLRRSGIYFSILTLAFAQMSYSLAYSVLTPITNGETGLYVSPDDPRLFDSADHTGELIPTLLGFDMRSTMKLFDGAVQLNLGFYVCAVLMLVAFYIALRIFRSPFGMMLKAIKSNQNRLNFTGVNTRPYTLTVFVISGMYAGLAGSMLAVTDPLAGAERMQWTASGEVVLMTILGGAGSLLGPLLGAVFIKYFENIFSAFSKTSLQEGFSFLPDTIADPLVSILSLFVGEGWHLTLGVLFMLIIIFLPGGVVEGIRRIGEWTSSRSSSSDTDGATVEPAK